MQANIEQAAEYIQQADGILITAGAGMGIDSGLPDFRGASGFWRAFPPLAKLQLNFEEMATPDLFERDPRLAWGFYGLRLNSYRNTVPHQGFHLLQKWAKSKPNGAFVCTSNVDGQFQTAGFAPERVLEKHGTIHRLQCTKCHGATWSAEDFIPEVDMTTCRLTNALPKCPHCGALARPNILMFDDYHWVGTHSDLQSQRLNNQWLKQVKNKVIIEIGAGTAVATIRYFSEQNARKHSAHLIRINPNESDTLALTPQATGLAMGGLEALQAIDTVLSL